LLWSLAEDPSQSDPAADGWFALSEMRRFLRDVLRGAIRHMRAPEVVAAVKEVIASVVF
jgi:hypothetical protein